jgi:hypothetical protein
MHLAVSCDLVVPAATAQDAEAVYWGNAACDAWTKRRELGGLNKRPRST